MTQLEGLVESGNTVIVVEHEMKVVAASDWVVDIGPGAGEEGGRIVASGPPADVARTPRAELHPTWNGTSVALSESGMDPKSLEPFQDSMQMR